MSQFQLPDGTRLWADGFKNEKIAIHLGNEVELEQWGSTDAEGKTPAIRLDKEDAVQLRLINRPSNDKPFTVSKRRFGLKAVAEGVATLSGNDSATTSPLRVLAGDFRNHRGMVKDLLADVGRGANPYLLYQLQRLLHSDTNNLFNQLSDANVAKERSALACGRVAKRSGEVLIGKVISHSFEKDSSYHLPTSKVTSRNDVEYDPDVMLKARLTIARHVKNGHPVLVGCAFDPKTSMLKDGHLQATRDGGHTVLIVGCNETAREFLYVDPYPGGSTMTYKGGIAADSYPSKCFFLSTFKVDSFQELVGRGPVLRSSRDSDGEWSRDKYLEVISGPKV
ncbi:hypothetical protein [Vineibacter terrae]|uniref:hypothetical protein n=1 Tax=Vineibacter terrae TaxID=2586908 RepID=UPI002E2F6C08|nr:hypothetical protein [Vineibacter terrae]HEX2885637.1 hypothetical protein [Vineibacter terrae]